MNPNAYSPTLGCRIKTHSLKEFLASWSGETAALTCLAALYMCLINGSFLIIYSPSPTNALPIQDEANTPVPNMKSIEVKNPRPNT
mmetsp:Transcript_2633/g.5339  ORF Transcript_2633/g.5339 Transcript_2633/m.5339 type:complete len:86 (-) Transcript_2633:2103-2360(-)